MSRAYVTLWMIIALLMVGQLGETLYLPAMPVIANELETDTGSVQWLLALFLIAYGLAQFVYGPLSDYFGRRPIIIFCLLCFVASSIMATTSQDIEGLLFSNTLVGMSIGCGGLMARTVLRDLFDGAELQKATSVVGIAIVFTPMAAPVVGAYLLVQFGWRADFAFFVIMGILMLGVFIFCFKETNPYVREEPLSFRRTMIHYHEVFTHRQFLGNMLAGLFNLGALMAYDVAAPFIFQKQMGFSPVDYAWVALVPALGFLLGSYCSGSLAKKHSNIKISHWGNQIACVSSVALIFPCMGGTDSCLLILLPICCMLFGSGLLFSSTTAGALHPFPHLAGVAGATLGGFQNFGAGVTTGVISYYEVESVQGLMLVLLACSALGYACFAFLTHERLPKQPTASSV